MTVQSDQLRDRRRAFAAPGGFHDKLVRLLATGLPVGVGVILAVMIITPLFPRSEVSFLLDRNRVAVTEERWQVDNATYRGEDNLGHPFSVTAGDAVQHSAQMPLVQLRNIVAHLLMNDGPAQVVAPTGTYDIASDRVDVDGPVEFTGANGYHMETSAVAIQLRQRRAVGSGGVHGSGPAGTFASDQISADLAQRTVVLNGHAHLTMTQVQLRTLR